MFYETLKWDEPVNKKHRWRGFSNGKIIHKFKSKKMPFL